MFVWFKALSWGGRLGVIGGFLLMLAVVVGSAYTVGYNKGENVSRVAISQYEGKIQKLNADLAKAQGKVDVRVVTQYKDRVEYIDHVVYKNRDVIHTVVPEQFTLSKGWIYAYNQSVRGAVVDPKLASDAAPSTVSEMRALADTIAPNNGICLATGEQLKSLQQWINESADAREKVTK